MAFWRKQSSTSWILSVVYTAPLAALGAIAYSAALHALNPRVDAGSFLLLSSLEVALPLLAVVAHAVSLPVCFGAVAVHLFRDRVLRPSLLPAFLYHAALVAFLVLGTERGDIAPMIWSAI